MALRLHRFDFAHDRWWALALLVAAITALPLITVGLSFRHLDVGLLQHLADHVLPRLINNTLWLLVGVGIGVTVIGVTLAWLTAVCEFPARRFFDWSLILPLAFPAYVTAFVFIGLLDFTGTVPSLLRQWGHPWPSWLQIRSRGGIILVMTLAFYPYVYLTARAAFLQQRGAVLESFRSLGLVPWQGFLRVSLPMARPWIAAGLLLVWMEVLADFGAVSVFNYDTFTTAIYKAWYGLFSLNTAAQLACVLVLFSLLLLTVEQRSRRHMRYAMGGSTQGGRLQLRHWHKWAAFTFAALIFTLGCLIPLAQLLIWTWRHGAQNADWHHVGYIAHSLLLAISGSLVVTIVALLLAYVGRLKRRGGMPLLLRISTLGYAFPGAVLAVGFFIPLTWVDNALSSAARDFFGWPVGQILKGTLVGALAILLLAYLVRFLAVAFHPLERGLLAIPADFDDAARLFGLSPLAILRRIHIPLLRSSVLAALALSFVDLMKEMPITLMIRPFGWDTLAVRIFEFTAEGDWERAALPSLTLVLVGAALIVLATRHIQRHDLSR